MARIRIRSAAAVLACWALGERNAAFIIDIDPISYRREKEMRSILIYINQGTNTLLEHATYSLS